MTDIRKTTGHRPAFGNEDTHQAWALESIEARAQQVHAMAVAPQCTLLTHDGRRLAPGDEVRLERDFVDVPDRTVYEYGMPHTASGSSAVVQLARLVDEGIVLDRNGVTVPHENPKVTRLANQVITRLG